MASTAGLTINEKAAIAKLDPQALLSQAVAQGATVETLERLFSLAKDVRAEQAKEAWNRAMVAFQKECPMITKNGKARIRAGNSEFGYSYATLDAVMGQIVPLMTGLDLSISWRHRVEANRVTANCRISHGLGHFEESGEVAMPIGEDRSGANAAQKVGIALTYAKRYSLLSIVGIAPEDDPDAAGTEVDQPKEYEPAPLRPPSPPSRSDAYEDSEPAVITEAQHKRMWAIVFARAKKEGMDEEWAKSKLINLVRDFGFGNTKQVTVDKYKAICADLEAPF